MIRKLITTGVIVGLYVATIASAALGVILDPVLWACTAGCGTAATLLMMLDGKRPAAAAGPAVQPPAQDDYVAPSNAELAQEDMRMRASIKARQGDAGVDYHN